MCDVIILLCDLLIIINQYNKCVHAELEIEREQTEQLLRITVQYSQMCTFTGSSFFSGTGSDLRYASSLPARKSFTNFSRFSGLYRVRAHNEFHF